MKHMLLTLLLATSLNAADDNLNVLPAELPTSAV